MSAIDPVRDDFSVTMFINVHEIVHDSFLSSIEGVNPVRTLVYGVVKF